MIQHDSCSVIPMGSSSPLLRSVLRFMRSVSVTQIRSGSRTVRSSWTSPVFNVPAGSKSRTRTSSSATGRCSSPCGHDEELAFLQPDFSVPVLHAEPALHDEEQLVLVVVLVPDELAEQLHQLDVLAVQFADDLGLPVLVEESQLLGQVYLAHEDDSLSTGLGVFACPTAAIVHRSVLTDFDSTTGGPRCTVAIVARRHGQSGSDRIRPMVAQPVP